MGREKELATLKGAFDAACAGQGGLVMVVGEPGIGKTAICEQLGAYVAAAGGRTLAGHCYEEGSLALPYLPFVEALRSYVLDRDAAALRQELGAGAPDVARIVPDLRDRLQVEPSSPTTPEEDRFRLFQAVVAFLRSAAAEVPLCLVLEDLHDADKGTLELLTHLGRDLAAAHLLVLGTYRDVEVDRAHPLSGALAELRRGARLRAHPAARPDPGRGATHAHQHRGAGDPLAPGRGGPPSDRGQPPLHPGSLPLRGRGGAAGPRAGGLDRPYGHPGGADPRGAAGT